MIWFCIRWKSIVTSDLSFITHVRILRLWAFDWSRGKETTPEEVYLFLWQVCQANSIRKQWFPSSLGWWSGSTLIFHHISLEIILFVMWEEKLRFKDIFHLIHLDCAHVWSNRSLGNVVARHRQWTMTSRDITWFQWQWGVACFAHTCCNH